MARMPGAIWRPLAPNWDKQPRMEAWDIFCLHTMVGTLDGTDGYFRNSAANGPGYAGTESHFGVGPDGTIYQWQDTAFQAEANYNGNDHIVSSENADMGPPFPKWSGSDVPPFTPQQVEANARIAAWLNEVHRIPLISIPDSKRGRRGVGVHRLGVPGYVIPGGEAWSTKLFKACPGDRRIAQVPQIIARGQQIAASGSSQEDDMPYTQDQLTEIISRAVWERPPFIRGGPWPIDRLAGIDDKTGVLAEIRDLVQETRDALIGGNAEGQNNFHWADEQQQERFEQVLAKLDQILAAHPAS